jgi:hypothetical protein
MGWGRANSEPEPGNRPWLLIPHLFDRPNNQPPARLEKDIMRTAFPRLIDKPHLNDATEEDHRWVIQG